jgi:2-phosphosulfolactate phosphatase
LLLRAGGWSQRLSDWDISYRSVANAGVTGGTAVAIDVIRAFTTAAWAFELGAERFVLVQGIDEALALKERLPGSLAMKDGEPLPGFDLTNSPAHMQRRADIAGKTIVQRTTHGTQGAVAARGAAALYCAAFVNAAATALALRNAGPGQITFIVTGDDGQAEEDLACAQYIAALLGDPSADPAPYLHRAASSGAASGIARRVREGKLGVDAADVGMTLEVNRFDFVMRARVEDGLLVLQREQAGHQPL